jgi:transcriptional regulator with XRE-family HTH domain
MNLRAMLRAYRSHHRRSTRSLAADIGIPPTTLSRFESSSDGMTGDTLAKIVRWSLASSRRSTRGTP